MKIITKKPKWQDIDDESQFFIDYATIEQQDEISSLVTQMILVDESLIGATQKGEMDEKLNAFSDEEKTKVLLLSAKLGRLALKYQVKNWKGITNGSNKPIKIKLVPWVNSDGIEAGTQIEEELFNSLVQGLSWWNLIHIYNCISQVTGMNESDKKK